MPDATIGILTPVSNIINGPEMVFSKCVLLTGPIILTVESFSINDTFEFALKSDPSAQGPLLSFKKSLTVLNALSTYAIVAVLPDAESVTIAPTVGINGSPFRSKLVNLTSVQPFHISTIVCSLLVPVKVNPMADGSCTNPLTLISFNHMLTLSLTLRLLPCANGVLTNHFESTTCTLLCPWVCDSMPI